MTATEVAKSVASRAGFICLGLMGFACASNVWTGRSQRGRDANAVVFGLLMVGLSLLAGGCVYAPTSAERAATFAPYESRTVQGRPIRDFLADRSAMVIMGAGVALAKDNPHRFTLVEGPAKYAGFAMAVAVDPRGYFLTAAHCVDSAPLYLVNLNAQGLVQFAPARVVWRGEVKHVDLAILHAPLSVNGTFTWAAACQPGTPVLAMGIDYGDLHRRAELANGFVAGKIFESSEMPGANPATEVIVHDALVHQGDSGGPLATVDGRLIGVNTGGSGIVQWGHVDLHVPLMRLKFWALRPDLRWLRQVIDRDAATQGAGRAAGAPLPPTQKSRSNPL